MHVVKANIQNIFRFKQLYLKPIVQVLLELSCHQRFMLCLHFLLLFQYRPCFGLLAYWKTEDVYHRKINQEIYSNYMKNLLLIFLSCGETFCSFFCFFSFLFSAFFFCVALCSNSPLLICSMTEKIVPQNIGLVK